MNSFTFLLVVQIFAVTLAASSECSSLIDCQACTNSSSICAFCSSNNKCMPLLDSLLCSSNNSILITENCPASPNPAFVDALGRYTALPLIGAAIAANETALQTCLTTNFPNAILQRQYVVPCDNTNAQLGNCSAYIALLNDTTVAVAFRGSTVEEVIEELGSFLHVRAASPIGGLVLSFFDKAFSAIMASGFEQDLQTALVNRSLVAVGHSLGGALATLTAATAISKGYVSSANVTLVTFGGPRIGDLKFATSLNQIMPTTYRVVHAADVVPHLPPALIYWQTDFEVWYPTGNMTTADFTVCPQADPLNACSNALGKYLVADHLTYYDQVLNDTQWINGGCVVPII